VRVALRGGTYYLDQPLEFGPEDSGKPCGSMGEGEYPTTYAAAAGEQVVISGGSRLQRGQWGEVNGHKAWMVDIPEVKDGTWRFTQLFVNGERRPQGAAWDIGAFEYVGDRAQPDHESLKEGDVFNLGGRKATLTKLDTLPYVKSEYTKRFEFDSYENPKLKELRERYKLEKVIAQGKDEFDQQVLLMDWTHRQFKKFGRPSANPKGALEILRDIEQGHTLFLHTLCHGFRIRRRQSGMGGPCAGPPAAPRRRRRRIHGAHLDGNLVKPIPQVDHARSYEQHVPGEGGRASQRS